MNISDVPAGAHVGTVSATDHEGLTIYLARVAAGTNGFTHMVPIAGLSSSVRLVLTDPHPEASALPHGPLRASQLANEFIQLIDEARWPKGCDAKTRAWRVERTSIGGKPAALVFAASF